VESDRRTVLTLVANLEHCRLQDSGKVVRADWRAALRRARRAGDTFDLLLLDPPWKADETAAWLTATGAVAAPDALLCLERQRGPRPDDIGGWAWQRTLQVGDTAFHLFARVVPDDVGC
jgi:16S rRNA G966 N2-methylase RsmD